MNQSDGKPDVQQGLYRKYNVERLNDPTGKHKDCHYYVLDLVHDKHAVQALLAYAASCETEFPTLAFGLRREAATTARRLGVALSETPPQPASEATVLAEEWKGRADDAGRLSRAVLAAAPPSSDARAVALKCAEIADMDWTTSGNGAQGQRISAAIRAYANTLNEERKP